MGAYFHWEPQKLRACPENLLIAENVDEQISELLYVFVIASAIVFEKDITAVSIFFRFMLDLSLWTGLVLHVGVPEEKKKS